MVPLPERNDKAVRVDLEILKFLEPGMLGVYNQQCYSFVAEGIVKPIRLLENGSIVYPEITGGNRDYMGEFSRNSIEKRCWLDAPQDIFTFPLHYLMLYVCTIKGTRYVLFLEQKYTGKKGQEKYRVQNKYRSNCAGLHISSLSVSDEFRTYFYGNPLILGAN